MAQQGMILFNALGTVCRVTAAADDVLLHRVREWVCGLDRRASLFRPDSEVVRLNQAAGREAVPVSDDLAVLLEAARQCSRWSGGAFSITAGPLAALWRQALRTGHVPEEGDLARAAALLCGAGVTDFCLDFGGTLVVRGRPRMVDIRHPQPGVAGTMAGLTVREGAVVTSGTYEQSRSVGPSRIHHIIDCRTGRPAASGVCSVTLLGRSAADLDALATACLVLGPSASLPVLRRLPGPPVEAVFVTDSYDVLATPGLQDHLRLRQAVPSV